MEPLFDTADVFDDDYLYFHEDMLTERADAEVDLICRLLDLRPNIDVLDAPCGHGRIGNRLAARGAKVTGVDVSSGFLTHARRDADRQRLDIKYVQSDIRDLQWVERFDRVVNWFTSFGYFSDEGNRRVLAQFYKVLRPGGAVLIETMHPAWLIREFEKPLIVERNGAWLIDRYDYDALTGRSWTTRTFIRGGRSRNIEFSIRLPSFPELRDWLCATGFSRIEGYGSHGERLRPDSRRMLVVAWR